MSRINRIQRLGRLWLYLGDLKAERTVIFRDRINGGLTYN